MADDNLSTEITDAAVADAPAAPATDDAFDALLREFDEATAKGADQPQPTEQINAATAERDRAVAANLNAITEGYQLDARRAEVEAAQARLQAEIDQRDEAQAVAIIRGSLPAEKFDDRLIGAWLVSRANENPAIFRTWLARTSDPKTYGKIVDRLAGEFQTQYGRGIDEQATADHAAVAAAVRDAGGKIPTEPPARLGRMNTNEYRQHIKESYGFDPGV